jgi:DNA polymerase I-like protein with 3'-5' exonuclease and polymerase domains
MEAWQKEVIRETQLSSTREKDGYVTIPVSGREIPVERGAEYRAINYLCQGSAADIMKRNLLKLDAAGYGDSMSVPVHDEIVLEVDEHELETASREIVECMTTTDWEVPFTADVTKPLSRWGDKY